MSRWLIPWDNAHERPATRHLRIRKVSKEDEAEHVEEGFPWRGNKLYSRYSADWGSLFPIPHRK